MAFLPLGPLSVNNWVWVPCSVPKQPLQKPLDQNFLLHGFFGGIPPAVEGNMGGHGVASNSGLVGNEQARWRTSGPMAR